MTTDVIGILQGTDLLGSVPPGDLGALVAVSRLRAFRPGQVVFMTGDPGDTLVVVASGRVKVVARAADGNELTLTVIGPGGVFGELSVADAGPRSADAETLDECQLLFVPRAEFWDICSRVPTVAQALAGSLAATLRRTSPKRRRTWCSWTCRAGWRRYSSTSPGQRRNHQAHGQPGVRASGRGHPPKCQCRTARLRTARMDRGAWPDRDPHTGSGAEPVCGRLAARRPARQP